MRRVCSRQRLVSWDAFDATANGNDGDATSSDEEYCSHSHRQFHTPPNAIANANAASRPSSSPIGVSRKRERSKKINSPVTPMTTAARVLIEDHAATKTSMVTAFSWEFASSSSSPNNEIPMDDMPEDVYLYMCSFLDLQDLRNVLALNRKFRHLLLGADSLWMQKCRSVWDGLLPATAPPVLEDQTKIPTVVAGPSSHMTTNLPLLISMTPEALPTQVDESMLGTRKRVQRNFQRLDHHRAMLILDRQRTPDVSEAELIARIQKNGRVSIQYTGRVGSGDRCIRSNHPLPRPTRRKSTRFSGHANGVRMHPSFFDLLYRSTGTTNDIQGTAALDVWRPFVSPYAQKDGSLQIGPRMVAYFEVSILEQQEPFGGNPVRRDCVAVGVATESFSCQTRMPGWDSQSFGYHGDDGGSFHASGAMLERFGPCFGTGDTVGCGIDYVARGIFFTLNGEFLGYGWRQLDLEFLENNLYGVVGIDTNDPVTVNYGGSPFQFNLSRFTSKSKHDELISHQYRHSEMEAQDSSELADLPSYPEV